MSDKIGYMSLYLLQNLTTAKLFTNRAIISIKIFLSIIASLIQLLYNLHPFTSSEFCKIWSKQWLV